MGKYLHLLTLGAAMMALVSCGITPASSSESKGTSNPPAGTSAGTAAGEVTSEATSEESSSTIDADPLAAEMLLDFSSEDNRKELFASDGWTNGGSFNCVWSKKNLTYSDDQMHLGIKEEEKTAWLDGQEVTYPYSAGEARTHHHYGPGDYEVRMKPTDVVGSVSSFFVCTGNYDTVDGVPNPWDEVDIEFLGKDPTHVQFNYFVNGVGGHEHMHELGFDASKEFHNYGFRWNADSITWFVDGTPVYQVFASKENPLPVTPGRIMTNYWPSSAEGWSGKFEGAGDKTCDYEWIKAKGERMLIDGESDPYAEPEHQESGVDWTKVDVTPLVFTTEAPDYTLTTNEGVTTVEYTDLAGNTYRTINADISSVGANNNHVRMLIKNEGNDTARVRCNVLDPEKAGQQNSCGNVSATMDGVSVNTDLVWGGSFFELEAGQEAECVVEYNCAPSSLEFMVDSAWNDGELRTGKVSFREFKLANVASSGEGEVTWTPVQLSFESTDIYTVTPHATAADSIDIVYTDANSYSNIGTYWGDKGPGKTQFRLDIENLGEDDCKFRVDLQGSAGTETATSCSATGGSDIFTDTTYGGSYVTVAPAEKVTFTITYDDSEDAANWMMFFIDSTLGTPKSGHVVVSNFAFGA